MKALDSLPPVPPHEMKQYLKDMEAVDEQMATQKSESVPEDIVAQLTPSQEETPTEQVADTSEKESQEANFNALREKALRAERERDELLNKFREMEIERFTKTAAPKEKDPEPEYDISLAPDALAEGKHIYHLSKKLRMMEDQMKQYQKQNQQNIMEAQLKAQYPDFDSVVSKANVEELKRSHPAIAQTLASAAANDAYSAAASAYTIIKEMGIAKSSQEIAMARKMIQDNASKPRSAQAASPQRGSTPLSKVNEYINDGRMTPEYQEQLILEMNQARLRSR